MPHIDSTRFGEVVIDGKKYHQVLIIGEEVEERDYEKLEELFGTSHRIESHEMAKLLSNKPEIIIIGTGQSGAMEVSKNLFKGKGVDLIIAETPEAIRIYNEMVEADKKVNALIHTTC